MVQKESLANSFALGSKYYENIVTGVHFSVVNLLINIIVVINLFSITLLMLTVGKCNIAT